ncbi:MAG TPA: hypothetical protein VKB79_09375 [Bryobacteraceae bacterium]|nr:hypothetical protein [Bryobacteraceae bacterium]
MPRLYSEFPGGYAGLGLLLLRLMTCGMLLAFEWRGVAVIKAAESQEIVTTSLTVLLIAGGALLSLGLLTAIAGSVMASIEGAWAVFSAITSTDGLKGNWLYPFLIAGTLATVILVGPGGFSLDAYFFGPKRVEIPTQKQFS